MAKEVKRIKLEQEDWNTLQRIFYEVNSRSNIVSTIIENHALDSDDSVLTSKAFVTYSNQLSALSAELEITKNAISEKYIPEEFKKDNYRWEADFSTGDLVIKE